MDFLEEREHLKKIQQAVEKAELKELIFMALVQFFNKPVSMVSFRERRIIKEGLERLEKMK